VKTIFRLSLIIFGLSIQTDLLLAKMDNRAIKPFSLPTAEQSKAKFQKHIVSLSSWMDGRNQHLDEFLCIGEMHDNAYRKIVVKIFNGLKMDNLILEATDVEIESFRELLKNKRAFKHLTADFSEALETGYVTNPSLNLLGAENTGDIQSDRDVSIALFVKSILAQANPSVKTVALYGHLHCGREDLGLGQSVPFFKHLERNINNRKFRNVRIVIPSYKTESQLLSLMARLNIKENLIVLSNPKAIDPIFFKYNAELLHLFQNYDDLIIDTTNAHGEN
jgi:hypothetical protein